MPLKAQHQASTHMVWLALRMSRDDRLQDTDPRAQSRPRLSRHAQKRQAVCSGDGKQRSTLRCFPHKSPWLTSSQSGHHVGDQPPAHETRSKRGARQSRSRHQTPRPPHSGRTNLVDERVVHEVGAPDAQVQHVDLLQDGVVEGVQEPGRVGDLAHF